MVLELLSLLLLLLPKCFCAMRHLCEPASRCAEASASLRCTLSEAGESASTAEAAETTALLGLLLPDGAASNLPSTTEGALRRLWRCLNMHVCSVLAGWRLLLLCSKRQRVESPLLKC